MSKKRGELAKELEALKGATAAAVSGSSTVGATSSIAERAMMLLAESVLRLDSTSSLLAWVNVCLGLAVLLATMAGALITWFKH